MDGFTQVSVPVIEKAEEVYLLRSAFNGRELFHLRCVNGNWPGTQVLVLTRDALNELKKQIEEIN